VFLFFFFFLILGTVIWSWGLLLGGMCCSSWVSPPPIFCFIFQIGSCSFCPGLALDPSPPTYAFWVAGVIGMYHHAQLVVVMGSFCPS
jgi:hypothetical protein